MELSTASVSVVNLFGPVLYHCQVPRVCGFCLSLIFSSLRNCVTSLVQRQPQQRGLHMNWIFVFNLNVVFTNPMSVN